MHDCCKSCDYLLQKWGIELILESLVKLELILDNDRTYLEDIERVKFRTLFPLLEKIEAVRRKFGVLHFIGRFLWKVNFLLDQIKLCSAILPVARAFKRKSNWENWTGRIGKSCHFHPCIVHFHFLSSLTAAWQILVPLIVLYCLLSIFFIGKYFFLFFGSPLGLKPSISHNPNQPHNH